jgi:hypothetical protein
MPWRRATLEGRMIYYPFMKRSSMGMVPEDSPMSAPVVVARD